MPPLNQSLMTTMAKERFRSFRLQAPPGAVSAAGRVAPAALSPLPIPKPGLAARTPAPGLPGGGLAMPGAPGSGQTQTASPLPMPPALFLSAGNTVANVESQRRHSDEFGEFLDRICAAICQAHGQWRVGAMLRGVTINGPSAMGGRLDGPNLEPLIKALAPATGCVGQAAAYANAVAGGLSQAWKQFCDGIRVPGLPWYPTFAAFPGPAAPPTPNVPSPLMTLAGGSAGAVTAGALKSAMVARLGNPGPFSAELFDAIATGVSMAVTTWLPGQMVMNVLGKGPVPTFAPPYIPVGPVVAGDIIEAPGHLAA